MHKGSQMAAYKIELSKKLANLLGSSKQEVESRLQEDVILSLLSSGKIDVHEAAELLNCDPDDLLTPEQEAGLIEGTKEFKRGEYSDWEEIKQRIKL